MAHRLHSTARTLAANWKRAALAALLAAALAACGPYAEIAQKLDVTARVAGDTWIASPSSDRTEVRVLIVGTPDEKGTAAFAFTALRVPITRGTSATTLQGRWTEVGTSGTTALLVEHEYFLPDESGKSPLDRRGAYRVDEPRSISLTVTRSAGRLAIAGDPELERMAGGAGSSIGRGGMITKVLAAKRAAGSGASTRRRRPRAPSSPASPRGRWRPPAAAHRGSRNPCGR